MDLAPRHPKEPLRVFTGEYRHTVDDKGRIAVPAKFRVQLGAGAVVSRWLDACLAIHTQAIGKSIVRWLWLMSCFSLCLVLRCQRGAPD